MINRVNKAPALKLVISQTKKSENDPGSSQGSGMMYDGPLTKNDEQSEEPKEVSPSDALNESGAEVVPIQKAKEKKGMIKSLNSVYEEFFKKKRNSPSLGLTTQYSDDHSSSKGMLLNKKVE